MADKSFGVEQLDIFGTGTPTIQSPTDLNLNANTVAISTNFSVGGRVSIASGIVTASSGVVTYYGDGQYLSGVSGGGGGITTAATNVQVTYEVTEDGTSFHWRFTGPGNNGTDNDPDIYLVRGQRYRFINNAGSSHPFYIKTTNITGSGNQYTDGVTNNGATSGNIDFNVQHDAPTRLFYQCGNHAAMNGNLYITGGANWQLTDAASFETPEIFTLLNVGIGTDNPTQKLEVNGTAKATTFSGSGASLTNLPAGNLTGTVADARISTLTASKLSGALPAISGASLTNLNGSAITSGTLPIARITDGAVTFAKMQDVGTGVLIGRNNSGSGDMETLSASEVRTLINVEDGANAGISTAASNFQVTFEILSTSSNSNGYRFSGPGNDGNDANPDLYLVRGQKYRFIQNAGSHPFEIQSSAGGSAYNTGVTNNGGNSGNIDFNVHHDAPTRLYYQCTLHGGMIGNIYITGGASWQTTDVNTSTTEEIFTLLNVGIGTDNPTQKLEVNGTIKADAFASSWVVGNNGASNYTFTGPGGLSNSSNSTLYLARGQTYIFDMNASGHGFGIQTVSGSWSSGNEYTTGITNPRADTTPITFAVPFSAPNTLYYACTAGHSGMVGSLVIYPTV